MVVLVGDTINTTVNVTRCGTSSCSVMTLHSQSLSCYFEVFAFDIESDGSVGTLAISGELKDELISKLSCAQNVSSGMLSTYTMLHACTTMRLVSLFHLRCNWLCSRTSRKHSNRHCHSSNSHNFVIEIIIYMINLS